MQSRIIYWILFRLICCIILFWCGVETMCDWWLKALKIMKLVDNCQEICVTFVIEGLEDDEIIGELFVEIITKNSIIQHVVEPLLSKTPSYIEWGVMFNNDWLTKHLKIKVTTFFQILLVRYNFVMIYNIVYAIFEWLITSHHFY